MRVQEISGVKGITKILKVDPRCIVVRKSWNPRIDFGELEDLMNSIIENGLLVPIRVRQNAQNELELIDGERRLRAILRAIEKGHDIDKIPAIYETLKNDTELMVLTLVTNQGKPLTPLEEAVAFSKLKKMGITVLEIAKRIGKSDSYVYEKLILVDADDETKEALKKKEISVSDAAAIVGKSKSQKKTQGDIRRDIRVSVNYKKLSRANKLLFEDNLKALSNYFENKEELFTSLNEISENVSIEGQAIFLYGKFKAMQEIFNLQIVDVSEVYNKIKV